MPDPDAGTTLRIDTASRYLTVAILKWQGRLKAPVNAM
jgi:hypothetical protein